MHFRTKFVSVTFFGLLFILTLTVHSGMIASANGSTLEDEWTECDLMWFKPDNIQGSVNSFFDRYLSLYNSVKGEKGLILNTGWLVSPIACWTGALSDKIYIPAFNGHPYPVWTYQNLKDLVFTLKREASARGIPNFRMGIWMYGNLKPYHNSYDEWSERHSESYGSISHPMPGWLDYNALLKSDKYKYAEYPDGIPQGTKLYTFFGKQVASFTSALNFDIIEFRDGTLGRSLYHTPGRGYDTNYYKGLKSFMQTIKNNNSSLKIMGYSTGASAVGELRCQSFDIEDLANSNLLDYYVTQSWPDIFYDVCRQPNDAGYSEFQLYTGLTRAMLAKTKCKYYVLLETIDAWEAGDPALYQLRYNTRMEWWLYINMFYKSGKGSVSAPDGIYISWLDTCLPDEEDSIMTADEVSFTKESIDLAMNSARNVNKVYGCSIFYNGDFMRWINNNNPTGNYGELIDLDFTMMTQLGIPLCSSARIEDFDTKTAGDFPVLQTPNQLSDSLVTRIQNFANNGGPLVIVGSGDAIDPDLKSLPNTIYWSPSDFIGNTHGVYSKDQNYARIAAQINTMAKEKGLSYIGDDPLQIGLWQLWRAHNDSYYLQLANFHDFKNELQATDKTYQVKISRSQLNLSTGPYHIENIYTGEVLGELDSDNNYLTFRIYVPHHNSFIGRIMPGPASTRTLAPASSREGILLAGYDGSNNGTNRSYMGNERDYCVYKINSTRPPCDNFLLSKFTADANGTGVRIKGKFDSAVTGKVKCALYADSLGSPKYFIQGTSELTDPGAGWQTFTLLSSQQIRRGTDYWLAVFSDSDDFSLCLDPTDDGDIEYPQSVNYGNWPLQMIAAPNRTGRFLLYIESSGQ
jgi:hypothetical protein